MCILTDLHWGGTNSIRRMRRWDTTVMPVSRGSVMKSSALGAVEQHQHGPLGCLYRLPVKPSQVVKSPHATSPPNLRTCFFHHIKHLQRCFILLIKSINIDMFKTLFYRGSVSPCPQNGRSITHTTYLPALSRYKSRAPFTSKQGRQHLIQITFLTPTILIYVLIKEILGLLFTSVYLTVAGTMPVCFLKWFLSHLQHNLYKHSHSLFVSSNNTPETSQNRIQFRECKANEESSSYCRSRR